MSASHALEPSPALAAVTGDASGEQSDFGWRVLTLTNAFRVLVAILLTGAFLARTDPRILGDPNPQQFVAWLVAMFLFAVVEAVLLRQRWPSLGQQVYIQLIGDLILVTGLMHAGGGISSGLGGLLVVTVGSLGLMAPGQAFLFAAMATLAVLGEQTFSNLAGVTSSDQYAPAGILGAVIFVMSAVVSGMGRRMQESESLARQRGVDLANLAELNDYIIQHLRESIVVVDERDRVRLMNESAANHLGSPDTDPGRSLEELSASLSWQVERWREQGDDRSNRVRITSADGGATINVNFAPLGGDRHGALLMFLEDSTIVAEKAQQSKLAALGRLSASIAHEIRNPIGAMSHAGQLLAESPAMGPDEQRLTDIIETNASRVSDIVESVLGLSRRESISPEDIALGGWMEDFAAEFTRTLELYDGALATSQSDGDLTVRMDPTHLRQVCWNLCDNAVKYASEAAGVIAVELRSGRLRGGRPYLEIADRGPGIDPERVDEIFEPFYTAGQGGTGLGLFISRELCECNGATLRYLAREGGGSIFRIVFADPDRWQIGE